ncbi:A disintegrin and metalloproteinase with thrombospondin motif 6 [Desmophyllum pertusum]|uniref:A disintegrin and metalloproteinase with thrombospondin motif 6 n=1 Tax=Desmophyllum pertusum TaxID=174260 RepID=A0A9X0CEP5_9CNID|nr:A disintegrin and metalloproteinase with thrombospondin motif 6 [Desmophyllum pertusum]
MFYAQFISTFLALVILPRASANSYENVHTLLTPNEREKIFGEPYPRNAFGQNFHLNVTLNDELLSPNFVIEVRGNQSSSFHFDIEHCHYTGHAVSSKGLGTKVAVSNCDGLRGLIRTPDDAFTINPLPDRLGLEKNKTRAHVIHRRSTIPLESVGKAHKVEKRSENWCGVEDEPSQSRIKRLVFDLPAPVNYNKDFTIETLIVADKKMTDFHGIEELKVYVPSLVNIVYNLLGDSSIGANMKYVLHKLLILEHDQEGLSISAHAGNTMTSFCEWAKGQNREDDSHPDHFDHAALISRYDFCRNADNRAGQSCEKVLGEAFGNL